MGLSSAIRRRASAAHLLAATLVVGLGAGLAGPAGVRAQTPLVTPTVAPSAERRLELVRGSSFAWVEGNATLGHFRGESYELDGWASFTGGGYDDARGRVTIGVAGFHTGKGLRDKHLRGSLEAERFPMIEFTLQRVDTLHSESRDSVRLAGTLTIHGSARLVSVPTSLEQRGDTLHVSGRLPIRFTEFGMQPPHKLLGTVRVDDDLMVGFEANFLTRSDE